jgi:hypothetical protein
MKIKILLSESAFVDPLAPATWDSFKTPKNQTASVIPQPVVQKPEELIAKQFGMTVVGDISVGETAYSNVYRVEPDDTSKYATKTLVLKLSKSPKEYEPYQEIKQIRERMLNSTDWDSEGDIKAAKYLPIVYLADLLQVSNDNPEYKSIIIMEPLEQFTGNIQDMPRMLSGDPTRTPKTLITMLKDEEFLYRIIGKTLDSQQDSKVIMNKIFTGVTPNISKVAKDTIDTTIRTRLGNGRMIRRIPEKPVEAYISPNKLTDEQKKKIEDWKDKYDRESDEFLANMKIISREFARIGYIMCDVLGDTKGPDEFETLIVRLSKSTPVAPVSGQNPYPQNPYTKPEQVVPGAEGFNDALERLERYGLLRKDLHGKNYMMREDGQIVISDPGLFIPVKAIKESKNAYFKIKIKRNY